MIQLHVLVNRTAGRGGAAIAERWRDYAPVVFDAHALDGVLDNLQLQAHDTILLAGGDGSISLLVGALRRRGLVDVRIALLPAGTGNDLARSLGWRGHGRDPAAFARAVAEDRVSYDRVQAWDAGGRPLLSYMSVGIDAAVIASAEQVRSRHPGSPTLRKLVLAGRTIGKLGHRIGTPVRVDCEGGPLEVQGKAAVLITNTGYFGAGSRVGAHEPGEPTLSVTVLERGFDLVLLSMARIVRRTPLLPHLRTSRVELDGWGEPAEIDGEPIGLRPCVIRPAGTVTIAVPRRPPSRG